MPLASISDLNGPPEEITRRINQAKRMGALYDTYVNMAQDGHERAVGIHASELYPCLRQSVYSLAGVPRRPNVSKFWKQRFKIGSRYHSMIQEDFEAIANATAHNDAFAQAFQKAMRLAEDMDCVIEFTPEVPVTPKHQALAAYWQLQSACDGIFTFRERATGIVVLRLGLEIKTSSPDEYKELKGPKFEHVRQAHLYMGSLDIPILWFFYINKGNQNNTRSEAPYLIIFQPAIWAELEDRFQQVHTHAQAQTLPPRTESIVCEFCAWSYVCQPSNSKVHSQGQHYVTDIVRAPGKV